MSDASGELRLLVERQELYDLALRYARAADRRNYEAAGALFTVDGCIEGFEGEVTQSTPLYRLVGRDGIVAGLRALEQFEKTFHQVANQLVEFDGDEARGETYCMAHHIHVVGDERWNRTMAIRYQDVFSCEEGGWLFSRRQLVIDWERDAPLAGPPPG